MQSIRVEACKLHTLRVAQVNVCSSLAQHACALCTAHSCYKMQTTAATNESCVERRKHLSLPDVVMTQVLLLKTNSNCAGNSNTTSLTPALISYEYLCPTHGQYGVI